MSEKTLVSLEQQLIAEIGLKDRMIRELEQERKILERLLLQARQRELGARGVARSNSVRRVMAEDAILKRLRQNVPPETTIEQLWIAIQGVGVASKATLRSHLHRLKEKGLIEGKSRGRWRLAEVAVEPDKSNDIDN